MSAGLDPYYRWLGIPPKDQPPHHYRLLGLEVFEDQPDVIDAAANRVMSYLKDLAAGDESQRRPSSHRRRQPQRRANPRQFICR